MACLAGETEQVVTVERTAGREVRSWIAVPYISTSGPLDPRLEPLTIFSTHVVGLGVCAASTTPGPSPIGGPAGAGEASGATLTNVRSIRQIAGAVGSVDLGLPSLLPGALNGHDPALLYGPPSGAEAGSSTASGAPTTGAPGARPSGPEPSSSQSAWRAGSYAIAFHFSFDDVTVVRWLRVDLVSGAGGGA